MYLFIAVYVKSQGWGEMLNGWRRISSFVLFCFVLLEMRV